MPSMQHTKERRNRTDYAGLLSHEKARFPVDGRRVDAHRRSGRCRGADCKERKISTAAAFRGLSGVEPAIFGGSGRPTLNAFKAAGYSRKNTHTTAHAVAVTRIGTSTTKRALPAVIS